MTYYRFLETDGMVLFQEIQVNCQSRGLEQYGSPPSVAESGGGVRERERERDSAGPKSLEGISQETRTLRVNQARVEPFTHRTDPLRSVDP